MEPIRIVLASHRSFQTSANDSTNRRPVLAWFTEVTPQTRAGGGYQYRDCATPLPPSKNTTDINMLSYLFLPPGIKRMIVSVLPVPVFGRTIADVSIGGQALATNIYGRDRCFFWELPMFLRDHRNQSFVSKFNSKKGRKKGKREPDLRQTVFPIIQTTTW